VHVMSTMICRW